MFYNKDNFFSATEFREWLVHFSVPVLLNILEEETYLHYILFVSAISTFVRDDLKKDDINFAEHCLQDFCKLFPKIYGKCCCSKTLSDVNLNEPNYKQKEMQRYSLTVYHNYLKYSNEISFYLCKKGIFLFVFITS